MLLVESYKKRDGTLSISIISAENIKVENYMLRNIRLNIHKT